MKCTACSVIKSQAQNNQMLQICWFQVFLQMLSSGTCSPCTHSFKASTINPSMGFFAIVLYFGSDVTDLAYCGSTAMELLTAGYLSFIRKGWNPFPITLVHFDPISACKAHCSLRDIPAHQALLMPDPNQVHYTDTLYTVQQEHFLLISSFSSWLISPNTKAYFPLYTSLPL